MKRRQQCRRFLLRNGSALDHPKTENRVRGESVYNPVRDESFENPVRGEPVEPRCWSDASNASELALIAKSVVRQAHHERT